MRSPECSRATHPLLACARYSVHILRQQWRGTFWTLGPGVNGITVDLLALHPAPDVCAEIVIKLPHLYAACLRSYSIGKEMDMALDWEEVDSSNVARVGFHKPSQTIYVQFLGGGLYAYTGQTPHLTNEEVYSSLAGAISVGDYLDRVIKKGNYAYTRFFSEAELEESLNVA